MKQPADKLACYPNAVYILLCHCSSCDYESGKKEIIREIRRWMKGKQIHKEKVRQYLNELEK